MLIKELPPLWPPAANNPKNNLVGADLGDSVVSVQNKNGRSLVVTLRTSNATEYSITLNIPENVFQHTILSIITKPGITLREVGEIDLAKQALATDRTEIKLHTKQYDFTSWMPRLLARMILPHRM